MEVNNHYNTIIVKLLGGKMEHLTEEDAKEIYQEYGRETYPNSWTGYEEPTQFDIGLIQHVYELAKKEKE